RPAGGAATIFTAIITSSRPTTAPAYGSSADRTTAAGSCTAALINTKEREPRIARMSTDGLRMEDRESRIENPGSRMVIQDGELMSSILHPRSSILNPSVLIRVIRGSRHHAAIRGTALQDELLISARRFASGRIDGAGGGAGLPCAGDHGLQLAGRRRPRPLG